MSKATLISLAENLVNCPAGPDSDDFNHAVESIQALIGQSDGGLAGVVFDDLTDETWLAMSKHERRRIVARYIKAEIDDLLVFRALAVS